MKSKVFDYTKSERFAVIRKLEKNRRYYCNFKALYETREAAEVEAVRLAGGTQSAKFYVIEIQRITSPKRQPSDKPKADAVGV